MNAIAAPKSHRLNLLEGLTLTAIFQAVPTFASAVLMLKLAGSREIVGQPGGAAIFVVLASLIFASITVYFGPRFPNSSGTATSRCSSTRPCHSPKRSCAGGCSPPRRCNW